MCLGLAQGCRKQEIKAGDKLTLHYYGKQYPYEAKETPNGIVLVHDSTTPLGPPLGALPVEDMGEYDFRGI